MSAQILDGKALAHKIKNELKAEIKVLKGKVSDVPHIVNIMVGKDPGTCAYANSQKRVAEQIGIKYELKTVPEGISQDELTACIQALNCDKNVNGIMLHKPVPNTIDYGVVANAIGPEKDLEGINTTNIGKMLLGKTRMIPCTPASCMEHIKSTGINLRGKEVVIVGASNIVGKPLSLLLIEEYATVSMCHIATSEAGRLQDHVQRADILVVAAGKAGLIHGDWIKEGALVIDVGINQVDGEIVGDVHFESAQQRAAYITPVPGGVGPVTVVMLMRNALEAFKSQRCR